MTGETDAGEYHDLAGIRVTLDPTGNLVGPPTGDSYHGLPVREPGPAQVPDVRTAYHPASMTAGRDSEQIIARALGEMDKPVLLEGEAGTGKNTAVLTLAGRTNRPVTRMNFGADTTIFDLVGEKDLVGGETVYVLGELAKAALFGWVFVGDEINMAEGDITSHLHAICEEVGRRRLTLRGTGRTLTDLPPGVEWDPEKHLGRYIHPAFRFVGTANPLSYAGTSEMNDAFRSRFVVLPIEYLPPEEEAELLVEETGVDPERASDLTTMAERLREAHRRDELETPISHRELLKVVELAGPEEQFMSIGEAARLVLVGHATLKLDKATIRDTITAEL
ncbi:AAA domain (dynein-related subfamily) [Halodesulfurarchaeum formicicum]|uniref:AAA domain (Dynein-related subfamily) n=1 Tax=Halodesulfurarchaeum formicicum TaxID=1873524 RepID=A0A1D8S681_9EURY|nr:AAA family ATPase [Halodesulfurarchaeum formicicum]AOW80849.1 AAA domain (dynein-related subfamily) [Halodesulfurarchaeum formicicum]